MKHIKTFESFINEAIKFNPKPFDKVKPGNTAYTVGDTNAWEVIATGYGDDYDSKLKKYDESGVVGDMKKNPKSYGLTPEEFADLEFIAIKHGNETMVFTYDDGGAWVNESLVNEGTTASSWTKAQLDKELKELTAGARDAGDIDDSMAFDIADGWISDNPGVEMVIKKYYNATDAQGFVANRIA